MLLSYGSLFRFMFKSILSLTGNKRMREGIEPLRLVSNKVLEACMLRQIQLQRDMWQRWNQLGIDAVVMPNYPIPAFKEENVTMVGAIRDYQFVWSLFHYPAGSVPITHTSRATSSEHARIYDTVEQFNDSISKAIKKDLETSHEMPVGVQVAARKWEDEVCLGVMAAIAEGIHKD